MGEPIPCWKCGEEISSSNWWCPECGHRQTNLFWLLFYVFVSPVVLLVTGTILVLVVLFLVGFLTGDPLVTALVVVGVALLLFGLYVVGLAGAVHEFYTRRKHVRRARRTRDAAGQSGENAVGSGASAAEPDGPATRNHGGAASEEYADEPQG